jgi:acetyltransferase-like isoleucine patch superfamily enzyme
MRFVLQLLKLFLRESRQKYSQLILRASLEKMGVSCAMSSTFNLADISKVCAGKGCSICAFSVLDISDAGMADSSNARIYLGDYVYIGDHCNIRASGADVKIGTGTMVANGVAIVSTNHLMDVGSPIFTQPWDTTRVGVTIGKDCWIGCRSVILPGSSIGDGVVIAAGAVVRGTIPPYTVWGGVPAKFIRDRK